MGSRMQMYSISADLYRQARRSAGIKGRTLVRDRAAYNGTHHGHIFTVPQNEDIEVRKIKLRN